MNIEVTNNVPNIKVTVNQSEDGSFSILLVEEDKKRLGAYKPGDIVKLGGREFIVLGHGTETTAVITRNFVASMPFGKNNEWTTSNVRRFCNDEFYEELVAAVGKDNIIEHKVDLAADDGTGKEKSCKDKVSIITTERYRRYREYLPKYGNWWWTATKPSYDTDYYRCVCCPDSSGALSWGGCDSDSGVRPFCILKSSILVSYEK